MKPATVAIALAAAAAMIGTAQACNGPVVTRTGPNGKTLTLCLDGKYSTCLRDSQRLGWSYQQARNYCDAKPNLTR